MRSIYRVLPILIVFSHAACQPEVGAGQISEEAFFGEYRPAYERLRQFYTNITIAGTLTKSEWTFAGDVRPEVHTLRAGGDRFRVDRARSAKSPGNVGQVQASVVGPKSVFTVRRSEGKDDFILRRVRPREKDELQRISLRSSFLFAPFTTRSSVRDIIQKLTLPKVKITAIEDVTQGGEALVRVSYTEDLTFNKNKLTYLGWLLFAKDKSWALRGSFHRLEPTNGEEYWSDIQYDGADDGNRLLASVEYWRIANGKRIHIQRFEVDELVPGPPPEREFSLAAFGIGGIHEEKERPYWLFLITVGVVLLAAALVIVRWTRLRRARA